MYHEAIEGDDAFAGTRVIDVSREAVDEGDVIAGIRVVDNGKVVDGDERAKGCKRVDEGCNSVDDGCDPVDDGCDPVDALGGIVMSSPVVIS